MDCARSPRVPTRQAGFALLMVTMAISILSIVVHIFVFRTKKELRAAVTEAEKTKAQYIAYSTIELTKLFLRVQSKVLDNNAMLKNLGLDMGQMLPMILPIFLGQGSMMNTMIGMDLEGTGLKPEQGTGGLEEYKPEDGKLNVNCAIGASTVDVLKGGLLGLFLDRRYDELFQRSTSDRNILDRQATVNAIVDFIDIDQAGSAGDEDAYYKSLREPYVSKNNLLDSVEEMWLIQGIDPIFWTNFGRSLTVYGSCKINLCSISDKDWVLIAGLIAASAKNTNDPVVGDPVKLKLLATTVAPQIMGICKDVTTFATAVQNPGTAGNLLATSLGVNVDAVGDLGNDGIADSEVQGVQLDTTKLSQLVTTGTSKRFYRLKVFGLVGKTRHSVEAVWDQLAVNQTTGGQGAFVYWREE